MMTHQHLCFHLLHRIKRNAYYDDNRGAAQCYVSQAGVYCAYDQREQCYNSEEQRTNEGDLAECLGDEVAGRLAGTEARDEAAVLLQVVGDLDRVELDGCIEVCKCEDQQCVQYTLV